MANNFKENGYLVIKNFLDKDEIENINKDMEIIKNNEYLRGYGRAINYCENGEINSLNGITPNKNCYLTRLAKSSKVKHLCDKLLNCDTTVRNCEMFLKPSKVGKKSPIHQDDSMWLLEKGLGLTIWCPLTPSNSNNGGLFYYEGSNNLGFVEHMPSNKPGTSQTVKDIEVLKNYKKVCFDLKPGDIVVHHIHTIHGSDENKSTNPRRVFTIQCYGKSDKCNYEKKKKYLIELKKQLIDRGQEENDGILIHEHAATDGFVQKEPYFF